MTRNASQSAVRLGLPGLGALALVCALTTPAWGQTMPGEVAASFPVNEIAGGFSGDLDSIDNFGISIIRLGDVDGDGIDDLAVGAPGDDDAVNQLPTGLGAVYVLFLNADGTVKAQQKISDIEGGFTGVLRPVDDFGYSLAAIGDFDGNGVPDMAVGAPQDDSGAIGGTADRGAVYLLMLQSDGTVLSHTKIAHRVGDVFPSLDDGDEFGTSVAFLGDLDGDGVGDIAVGAIGDDDVEFNSGAAWICFLLADGTPKSIAKISQSSGGFGGAVPDFGEFGRSLANLGDLDGDGNVELAVGVPRDTNQSPFVFHSGAIWVLYLDVDGSVKSETRISQSAGGFTGLLGSDDRFGTAAAAIGDLDGDGLSELAVGAPFDEDGGQDRGAVWVLFLDAAAQVQRHVKISSTSGNFAGPLDDLDRFGEGLGAVGDYDGDGILDLGVGSLWGGAAVLDNYGEYWMLRLNASEWRDLGDSLAGTHGAPLMAGAGTLIDGDPLSLTLSNALENTTATLVVGFSQLNAPFKGGVLVPNPDLLVDGLPTGPGGGFTLNSAWPSGIPSGFSLIVQPWIVDGAGPAGLASGNGLIFTVP